MKIEKKILHFTLAVIITINLATIPHLLLKQYWIMESDYLIRLTLFEGIYTLLILPIILLKTNKLIIKKMKMKIYYRLLVSFSFILIAIFLSDYFHFKNWSDMTGNGEDPDYGTQILRYILIIGGIITTLIGITIPFYKELRKK